VQAAYVQASVNLHIRIGSVLTGPPAAT